LLLISLQIFSQDIDVSYETDSVPSIEERYPGDALKLREFFSKNMRYPTRAVENCILGLSISSITISPSGTIHEISILNSLGDDIDYEVARLLTRTENHWLKTEKINYSQKFYIQLFYFLDPFKFDTTSISGFNILDPVIITVSGIANSEYLNCELISDYDLIQNASLSINQKNYGAALTYINEKIRRNPFDQKVYQLRIYCYQKLKLIDMMNDDVEKLRNFLNNKPLDYYLKEN